MSLSPQKSRTQPALNRGLMPHLAPGSPRCLLSRGAAASGQGAAPSLRRSRHLEGPGTNGCRRQKLGAGQQHGRQPAPTPQSLSGAAARRGWGQGDTRLLGSPRCPAPQAPSFAKAGRPAGERPPKCRLAAVGTDSPGARTHGVGVTPLLTPLQPAQNCSCNMLQSHSGP